jgi:hypothetical protein
VSVTGRRALLALSALAAACGRGPAPERVPEGAWGGEHIALVVAAEGAVVDLDCAHGEITAPLRLDPDGGFDLPGYHVRDVGPTEDPEDRRPATYSGTYDGRRLTLSFRVLGGGEAGGPFTAFLGASTQLQECRR